MSAHGLLQHPLSVTDSLIGATSKGSASCRCGGWQIGTLPNRAGDAEINRSFIDHLIDIGLIVVTARGEA